jgi:hypothetical protein
MNILTTSRGDSAPKPALESARAGVKRLATNRTIKTDKSSFFKTVPPELYYSYLIKAFIKSASIN